MMIHTNRPISRGTEVEIRRGDHVIIARVAWRDGARAGLQADDRVPVEEIMTLGQSPALQLTAVQQERRKDSRRDDRSRLQGRAMEFAGVLAVVASLAGYAVTMVHDAFVLPLAALTAVLAR
jgi:hypothetical protein